MPSQLSSFLLVGMALNLCSYKLWHPNFRCFALNALEGQEGMLLLSFLDENLGNTLLTFLREKEIRLERNLNTVMLGNLFASSALRLTRQIIKSVYDDHQKLEIDVQYKRKLQIWLKRKVNKADMTVFLSTRCYQKHIGNLVI